MATFDPIIAVKNIETSSKWYQAIFNCKSMHGGTAFDILVNENNEVLICLHQWEAHGHPTMANPDIMPGNGLILYFRTESMHSIRANVEQLNWIVEEDIHLNPNSTKMEFSLRDPDGYYLTITDFHTFEG